MGVLVRVPTGRWRRRIAVGGAIAATAVPALPVVAGDLVGVPTYKQSMSNICWATAVQIVSKKITNVERTQCEYVNAGKQVGTCPNDGGSGDDIVRALNLGGVTPGTVVQAPYVGFNQFKSEIDAGFPTLFNIGWKSGGYHQIVGMGYANVSGKDWAKSVKIQLASGTNPNAWPPPSGSVYEYREFWNFLDNSSYWVTNMRYNLRAGGK